MDFGDRLNQLYQELREVLASNQDRVNGAVHSVGSVANKATQGKFADTIAKAEQTLKAGIGKLVSNGHAASGADSAADAGATDAEGDAASATAGADGATGATVGDAGSATGDGEGAEPEGQTSEPSAGT